MEKYIFYVFFLFGVSAFIPQQNNTHNRADVTTCVVKIIEEWKFIFNYRPHLHLTVINIEDDLNLAALHRISGIKFISRKFRKDTYFDTSPSETYIFMSENYKQLEEALAEVSKDTYWNPTARFIIILQKARDNIIKIRNLLYKHNMLEVTLITDHVNDYAMYRFNVSTVSNVNEDLVLVSWCSVYKNNNSMPVLIRNKDLHNLRFRFIAPEYWPFISFNESVSEGTEQFLLKLFQNDTGVTIDLVHQPGVDVNGNGITDYASDVLRRVHCNEFEGAVGGFSLRSGSLHYIYSGNLSYSYPLAVDHMVYVLPHANVLDPWEAVFKECLYSCVVVAVLFIVFWLAATLLDIFSQQKKQVIRDLFAILGYMTNTSGIRIVNNKLPQRLILASIFFFALIMPYILQAYLISAIASPRKGYEPKKVEELDQSKLILHTDFPAETTTKYERDCGSELDCLFNVKTSRDKSIYTIITESLYHFYSPKLADNHCALGVYRLKSPYATLLRTVYLRRGSMLLEPLNRFLFKSMSGGLLNKYGRDFYHKYGLKCRQRQQKVRKALKLSDLNGAFVAVFVGHCISLFVFICEILFSKLQAIRST